VSQKYLVPATGLDQFFFDCKNNLREVTKEEAKGELVTDILQLRRGGWDLGDAGKYDLFPNPLNNAHILIFLRDKWVDGDWKGIFSELEIQYLINVVQGDFRYPYPPIVRNFRFGAFNDGDDYCPICKKERADGSCEIFLNWKGRELRRAVCTCIDCWDKIMGLFWDGWQKETIIIKSKRNPIQAALKHEVLKQAKYRCQDCGASNKDTELEVDHIIPVVQGGTDELDNLQVLCKDCNIKKNNRTWEAGK
jgi:5-methylcytosine-specific restriction endonuclease McrA